MPKAPNSKFLINLDLLKPQSNPDKLLVKLVRWLLSTGRYIFIFVEAIVLIAFITRFKFDEDLASKNEQIVQQIPYIQSLKSTEILIRQTQLKLSTINSINKSSANYAEILKKVSNQIPPSIKISNINIEASPTNITINLNATAQNNNDIAVLLYGLKQDPEFSEVNIENVGFEKGSLAFSIKAQIKTEEKTQWNQKLKYIHNTYLF